MLPVFARAWIAVSDLAELARQLRVANLCLIICTVRIASGRTCEFLYNIAMIYFQERSKLNGKVFEVDS